jgi:hypothetical protein
MSPPPRRKDVALEIARVADEVTRDLADNIMVQMWVPVLIEAHGRMDLDGMRQALSELEKVKESMAVVPYDGIPE